VNIICTPVLYFAISGSKKTYKIINQMRIEFKQYMREFLFLLAIFTLSLLSNSSIAQTCSAAKKISSTQGGLQTNLQYIGRFGESIANLGDIDGDGNDDIAVTAEAEDSGGQAGAGVVRILFLNFDGTVKSSQNIGNGQGGLMTPLSDDRFGGDVAGLGDLDGDGVPDLAVGAWADDDGGITRGAIYILFLNPDGTVKAEQKISDLEGGFMATLNDQEQIGSSVTNIGDLDGDGIVDLAIGAPLDNDGNNAAGAVFILFLNTDGTVKAEQKISQTSGGFSGTLAQSAHFGTKTSNIGDLDGDGNTDIVVTVPTDEFELIFVPVFDFNIYGALYILFLNSDGTVKADQKIDKFSILNYPVNNSDGFAEDVEGIGDFDNDGVLDISVSNGGDSIFFYLMHPTGTVKKDILLRTNSPEFQVLRNGGSLGDGLTNLGDLDNNGNLNFAFAEYLGDDGGESLGGLFMADLYYNSSTGEIEFQQVCPDSVINQITAANTTVCLGDLVPTIVNDSFDLTGPSPTFDGLEIGAVQWQQSTDNVTWEDIPNATTMDFNENLDMSSSTIYLRRYYDHCCGLQSYSNVVTITAINEAPTVSILPLHYCPDIGGAAVIDIEVSGGTAPYTYSWSPAAGLSFTNIAEPTVTFGSEDLYELTVTGSDGCEVQTSAVMIPIQANVGGDTIFVCNDNGSNIGMPAIPGISGITYSWSPTTDLSCTDCSNPIANPTSITKYYLSIDDGNGCTDIDSVVVNPNAYTADVGADVYVCRGADQMIGTATQAGITYGWAPGLYIDDQTIAQPTFNSGVVPSPNPYPYTLTTFDANSKSCRSIDTLLAHVAWADAGLDDTINVCATPIQIGTEDCCNGQATYEWTILSGDANSFYDTLTGTFSNTSNIPEPYVMPTTQYTDYQVQVTWGPNPDNSGGANCTDSRVIGVGCVMGCPVIDVSFDNTVSCGIGVSGTIMSVPLDTTYGTLTWSPATNLSCTDCANPTFLADLTSDISYRVDYVNKIDNSIACFLDVSAFDSDSATPVPLASDGIACPAMGVNIGNVAVSGYSYIWEPTTGLNNPTSSNPLATPSETTTYSLIVIDDVTGCSADTSVTVTVFSAAGASGGDATACIGESITIGATAIPGYTYAWSPMGDLASTNIAQPTANVTATETYTVTITEPGGCFYSESMTLLAATNFTVTVEDKEMCEGSTVSLLAEVAGADASNLTYNWSPSTGLSSTTVANPVVSGLTTDQTYDVTVTTIGGNCAGTSSATVTVNPLPTANLTDQNLCTGSIQIGLSPTPGYSYSWTPTMGLDNPIVANPNSFATTTTTYTLKIISPDGCVQSFDQTVNVDAPQIEAGNDIAVCEGTAISMGALSPEVGATYSWSPTDYLDDATAAQTIARPLMTTQYILTATGGGCTSKDTVTVYVTPGPSNVDRLDPFTIICELDCQEIGVSNNPLYTYQWLPAAAVESPTSSMTQICPLENTNVSLVVTETATGCSKTQNMAVYVTTGGDCPIPPPCISPTASIFAIQPSCDNGTAQSDGYLQISAVADGDKVGYSTGNTYSGPTDYNDAAVLTIGTLPFQFNMGLSNPSSPRAYTIRIFNSTSDCFTDVVVTMNEQDCAVGCDCNEYVYVNEPSESATHKFRINPADSSLTEINPIGTWYPNGGTSELIRPHGLGSDLNGYLYIGETNGTNGINGSSIRKLTCDGEIFPESEFNIPQRILNMGSIDNYLIARTVLDGLRIYDACTQTDVIGDRVCFERPGGLTGSIGWGLYIDAQDFIYLASSQDNGYLYKFTIQEALNSQTAGQCILPLFEGTAANPLFSSGEALGITSDENDNIYVVDAVFANPGRIRKFNTSGTLMAETAIDNTEGDGGWFNVTGIIYSSDCQCLYTSNGTELDDCISKFDLDLNPLGAAVGPVGGNPSNNVDAFQGKAIGLLKECCPTNNNITIDTTLCSASINDQLFLQELINCNGTICEGIWKEGNSNTGLSLDSCDNSVTINALNACGSFILESDGVGNSLQCGAFKITVNIEVENITAPVIVGNQTICENEDPAAFTTSTPASGSNTIAYQWQTSTSSCTDGFSDIVGAISETYDAGSISQTRYYRVISSVNGVCSSGMCIDTSNCVTLTYTTNPTATASITNTTCTGVTANTDGTITLAGFNIAERYALEANNSYTGSATFASGSTAIPVDGIITNTLANPVSSQVYTIRIFNSNECFVDRMVTLNVTGCGSNLGTDYADYSRLGFSCPDPVCHTISNDIYLGNGVTPDSPGSGSTSADSDLDDGVSISSGMQFLPGNTVRIPVIIYNNTGANAHLRMWIDWNGNGDFEDIGEQIENNIYASTGAENKVHISVTIPLTAMQNQSIALRTRLSTDDTNSANSCGNGNCAADGEVEDYLIDISCPTSICQPVNLQLKNE